MDLSNQIKFLIYKTEQEQINVSVVLKDENIWLTQKAMAELFGCSSDNVSLHIKNVYQENELTETATTEEFSVVQAEGDRFVKRNVKFYLEKFPGWARFKIGCHHC